jgi:hypothetical protein
MKRELPAMELAERKEQAKALVPHPVISGTKTPSF